MQSIDHGLSREQLGKIKEILSENAGPAIEKAMLFGSRAIGNYKNYSDIDLALYGNISDASADRLWTCFFESTLPYKVDIHVYQHINYPPLKRHIDQHAKTLFQF